MGSSAVVTISMCMVVVVVAKYPSHRSSHLIQTLPSPSTHHLKREHQPRARAHCTSRSSRSLSNSGSGVGGRGIVVVPVVRLDQVHGQLDAAGIDELAGDDGTHDEDDEEQKEGEVEDGIADDTALAQLGLLERVDWRADLAAVRGFVSGGTLRRVMRKRMQRT